MSKRNHSNVKNSSSSKTVHKRNRSFSGARSKEDVFFTNGTKSPKQIHSSLYTREKGR